MSELNNEFIPWEGGEMPVPYGTPVTVLHREGHMWTCLAGEDFATDWDNDPTDPHNGDIIAYKLAAPVVPSEQTDQMALAIAALANAALEFLERPDTGSEVGRIMCGQHLHQCASDPRILEAVRLLRLP